VKHLQAGVRDRVPHAGADFETLILGGGLAGLSSAQALIDEGFEGSVCIIEPRTRSDYARDRTWCMWDIGANPLSHLATHRWSRWIVRDEHRVVRASSEQHPYLRIPADRVYDHLLEQAEAAPSVTLKLGTAADRLEHDATGVRVSTEQGVVRGRRALDSRPVGWRPSRTGLLQSFLGWELSTADPVFDSDEVVLMDFRLRAPGVIEFFYVLPFAPDRALIESTVFGSESRSLQYHEERINRYVSNVLNTSVREVEYTEKGVIPMNVDIGREREPRNVRRIGLRGGVAKPSTGYAFLRIQDDARRVARELVTGSAAPQRRMTRARFLDGIFLSFLRNQPDRAPEAFLRLFDRVHADDLVAFLSEAGTLSTDWRVVRALPPAPFLAEVGRLSRDMIGSAPIPRLERRLPSMDPHQGSPQVAASR